MDFALQLNNEYTQSVVAAVVTTVVHHQYSDQIVASHFL